MHRRSVRLYNRFKLEVIDWMEPSDVITREQIKMVMDLSDKQTDELLWYIKYNLCRDGFNKDTMICNEGFKVIFLKPKKVTKMYIVKL